MLSILNPKVNLNISLLMLCLFFSTYTYAQIYIKPKYDINGGTKKSTWPNRKKAEREKAVLELESKKREQYDNQRKAYGLPVNEVVFEDIKNKRLEAENRIDRLFEKLKRKFGKDSTGEILLQQITSKFESIAPLDYFLSDYPKYSNKQKMIEVEAELRALMKIYRENYYVKGHISQKQNNSYILNSLIGIKYAEQGFDAQSPPNPHNSSIIQLKKFADKDIVYSEQSNNSSIMLNQAVLLMQKNKINDAEVIIDKIINGIENKNYKTYYLEYYNKALLMFEQKQYDGVKIFAKKSKNVRSDFYLADLLIGDAYLKTDSATEALKNYKKALSKKYNVVARERLAYANLTLGNYKEASFYYQNLINEVKRQDGIVYRELNALALAHQGKFDESLDIVSNLKAFKKDSPMPHFIEGWNYLLMSDYNKAINCFNEAENKGDKLYSGIGKAFSYYYLKNYNKSSEYFFKLEYIDGYEKYKNKKSVLQMAAYAFVNSGNFEKAEEKFNSYAKYYKKENGYYIGKSMCEMGKYHFKKAQQYLDSVKNPPKKSPDYEYLQGICNLKNENYTKAESFFNNALKLDSLHVKSYDGLGVSLDALGKYSQAISVFDKGIKLDKNNPYLIFNKGTAITNIGKKLFSDGNQSLAIDTVKVGCLYLDSAFVLDNSFRIKLNKGNAFMAVKDSSTAMFYYNRVNSLSSKVNVGVLQDNFGYKELATNTWKEVLIADSTEKIATYNLEAIHKTPISNFKTRLGFGNQNLKYYENYYYELVYHYDIEKPFIYEDYFEPLVPLGYSNLKFESLR